MAAVIIYVIAIICTIFTFVVCDNGGILQIHYPDVSIEADTSGNVTLQSGADASVYLVPGPRGTVYFDGNDLLQLIEAINGLPPVWKPHSSVGFFYTAFGGDTVNVKLETLNAENQSISYHVVAGTMPPGLSINPATKTIEGIVPDLDAIYSFTIRATNEHDKYADAIFRMEIIERNQCLPSNPCKNGGVCEDRSGRESYVCYCPQKYSGRDCDTDCSITTLGVADRSRVPDAMMSSFLSRENYTAADGRLNNTRGWCGVNTKSWLQVDLGKEATIFSALEQSIDSNYYTGSYYISYSNNGYNFTYIGDDNNGTFTQQLFSGTSSVVTYNTGLQTPVQARFVRFHPVSFSSSHFPCMRVELYGCFLDQRATNTTTTQPPLTGK